MARSKWQRPFCLRELRVQAIDETKLFPRIAGIEVHHLFDNLVGNVVSEANQLSPVDVEGRSAVDIELLSERHRLAHALLRLRLGNAGSHRVGHAPSVFNIALQHLVHVLLIDLRLMLVRQANELPRSIVVLTPEAIQVLRSSHRPFVNCHQGKVLEDQPDFGLLFDQLVDVGLCSLAGRALQIAKLDDGQACVLRPVGRPAGGLQHIPRSGKGIGAKRNDLPTEGVLLVGCHINTLYLLSLRSAENHRGLRNAGRFRRFDLDQLPRKIRVPPEHLLEERVERGITGDCGCTTGSSLRGIRRSGIRCLRNRSKAGDRQRKHQKCVSTTIHGSFRGAIAVSSQYLAISRQVLIANCCFFTSLSWPQSDSGVRSRRPFLRFSIPAPPAAACIRFGPPCEPPCGPAPARNRAAQRLPGETYCPPRSLREWYQAPRTAVRSRYPSGPGAAPQRAACL